jgi:hypothetical protein
VVVEAGSEVPQTFDEPQASNPDPKPESPEEDDEVIVWAVCGASCAERLFVERLKAEENAGEVVGAV